MTKTNPPSMKKRWKALGIAILLVFITRWLVGVFMPVQPWQQHSWQSLYTKVNLTLSGDTLKVAETIRKLDVFFSTYTTKFQKGSEIDQAIFNSRAGDTLMVDSLSYEVLAFGQRAYTQSKGIIHPGIGGLIKLWGLEYGQAPRVPTQEEIEGELTKMKSLFYDTLPGGRAILIKQDSAVIALGSYSKGYALEVARRQLLADGFEHFLLEIGGDLVYNGKNPRGKNWSIGITDPREKVKIYKILRLPFNHHALATSGGYENFFVDSLGKKHHHILNPKTGQSAEGILSTTILANTAFEADYLATYLFIAPQEAQNIADIDYLILDDKGEAKHSKALAEFLFDQEDYLP